MWRHSVDYLEDRDPDRKRGTLIDRGFWLNEIPRPLILCRMLGHKPVIDGTEGRYSSASHWVCCDRCGTRPEPQGDLDPERFNIGDPYDGPFGTVRPDYEAAKQAGAALPPLPGPWPDKPTWTFGGQAILGRTFTGLSAQVKVGNCGSEHTLAAHIRIDPIGALYLHTERLGTWLQRRLNPAGYDSRVIGVDVSDGRITWKLWAKRDNAESEPRWQRGSLTIDPRDGLLGRRRYWYTNEGEPVTGTVRMPHGDDHEVTLQLQRQEFGREKSRRRKHAWCVDWEAKEGIPTKPGPRGRVYGSGVEVSDAAVREGTWPQEASAGIAQALAMTRAREGMASVGEAV